MSDYENYEPHAAEAFLSVPGVTDQNYDVRPLKRSKVLHFFLIVPCMWAGISWLTGGVPFLTDLAFSTMLVICVILVATEVIAFSRRFGLGGIVLFGGAMVWYIHDYFSNWFNINFSTTFTGYTAVIVAKAAFFYVGLHFFRRDGLALAAVAQSDQCVFEDSRAGG
jgi:hypothetical protein